MRSETNTNSSPSTPAAVEVPPTGIVEAAEWHHHEHISEQVQLEAEKLVDMVGSPELAIHAINVVEQRQQNSPSGKSGENSELPVDRNEFILKALTEFENSMATPVVSGELAECVTHALRSCEDLVSIILGELQPLHAELFARILRQDINLSSQVEKLRETDQQLAFIECNEVTADFELLLGLARSSKQDEGKLATTMEKTIKRAMEFVIAVRTQETAIATWYSEAFHRDLGSGD